MAYPTFTVEPSEVDRDVGFTIAGTYGAKHPRAGETWTESFGCIDELSALLLSEITASATNRDGATVYRAAPCARFITSAVAPDRRGAFEALLLDPDRLIRTRQLVDIMSHLFEEYALRPTGPASASDGGQPDTGATSEDEPSSAASASSTD